MTGQGSAERIVVGDGYPWLRLSVINSEVLPSGTVHDHGNPEGPTGTHENTWKPTDNSSIDVTSHSFPWISIRHSHRFPWCPMGFPWFPKPMGRESMASPIDLFMGTHGVPWVAVGSSFGVPRVPKDVETNGNPWDPMGSPIAVPWIHMGCHGFPRGFPMGSDGFPWGESQLCI